MTDENKRIQADFSKLMDKKLNDIKAGKVKQIRDINTIKDGGKDANFHTLKCEAFTYMQQSNNPEKNYLIERWVREDITGEIAAKGLKIGDIEYRVSYYIVSRKPGAKTIGKWIFGQFSPMIAHEDFFSLIDKAKKEGTIK